MESTIAPLNSSEDSGRYEALLQTADLMAEHRDMAGLFHDLAERLQKVTECDVASFSLHDPAKNVMRVHMWEQSQIASPADEVPLEESLSGWVFQNQKPIIVHDRAEEVPFFPQHCTGWRKKACGPIAPSPSPPGNEDWARSEWAANARAPMAKKICNSCGGLQNSWRSRSRMHSPAPLYNRKNSA